MSYTVANNLLTSKKFHELHDQLHRFNVFEAFGVAGKEVRHNALLHYLLNPHETHGLGDLFLLGFLLELAKRSAPLQELLFSGQCDLHLTTIKTQFHHEKNKDLRPDLEMALKKKNGEKLVIVIEMKIWASAGNGQLEKYERAYTEGAVLVYLTPFADELVNQDKWLDVTYEELVLPALEKAIASSRDRTDSEIFGLLTNYCDVIASFREQNNFAYLSLIDGLIYEFNINGSIITEILELDIFRPYWKTLNRIKVRCDELNKAPLFEYFDQWCAKNEHLRFDSNESYLRFLPKALAQNEEFMKANGSLAGPSKRGGLWTENPAAVLFEIRRCRDDSTGIKKAHCVVVLGPVKLDESGRSMLRQNLREVSDFWTSPVKNTTSPDFSTIGVVVEPMDISSAEKQHFFQAINDWLEQKSERINVDFAAEVINFNREGGLIK